MGWDWGLFWTGLTAGCVAVGLYQMVLFLLGYRLHHRRRTVVVKIKPGRTSTPGGWRPPSGPSIDEAWNDVSDIIDRHQKAKAEAAEESG